MDADGYMHSDLFADHVDDTYTFMISVRNLASNARVIHAGTVQVDGTCGMIDIAGTSARHDDVISYSLPFNASDEVHDFEQVSGDRFGIIPMFAVPTVLFDGHSLTHETTGRLTEQHIPHAWRVSRANRTVVTRDPVSGYVIKVESYRHDDLIAVRSLVRLPAGITI
ncbi:hypothetical protein [Nocardia farcinica]|uniref:hypothetical protein n=1 Tax=Nocardia farcinica TaxID=37329 RepID=UPI0018955F53|nr:hypothetical protein [Nocardia farcinica]MBF6185080.1 hypothetical protein [Nocardia farcinica]MBF6360784.1 hypothetical protein [Nocardia farcinica]